MTMELEEIEAKYEQDKERALKGWEDGKEKKVDARSLEKVYRRKVDAARNRYYCSMKKFLAKQVAKDKASRKKVKKNSSESGQAQIPSDRVKNKSISRKKEMRKFRRNILFRNIRGKLLSPRILYRLTQMKYHKKQMILSLKKKWTVSKEGSIAFLKVVIGNFGNIVKKIAGFFVKIGKKTKEKWQKIQEKRKAKKIAKAKENPIPQPQPGQKTPSEEEKKEPPQ